MTDLRKGDSSAYIQANVGGVLRDAREAAISPLDRGFLYGDAIYEVWRTYEGGIFGWDEHWERLEATATGIEMELAFSQGEILQEIRRTVAAWREATGGDGDLYIRLQISRGAGPIGLDAALAIEQCFTLLVKALPDPSLESLDAGMRLSICEKWRRNALESLPPSLKTGNYLNNILGLVEARKKGVDDVLFLNAAGALTEASTRNLWLVFKDRIATPPLSDGMLAGVTRRFLLEQIGECQGRPLVEESLRVDDLSAAQECFLSSSTQDVQPVRSIDGQIFSVGADTVSRALKKQFRDYVRTYAAKHPDLVVD